MKAILFSTVVLLLGIQTSVADWVITQKTTAEGQSKEMTMKVKGDKARSDVSNDMTIIVNGATGEMAMLMHAQKTIMKMNADSMKGMIALAGNLLGGGSKPAKPVATGQKEKVGQWDAEIYTWSGSMGTGKFWVSKDFPQAAELNAIQDKIMKAMGNPQAAFAPASSDFPGVVVKSEMTMMGKTAISEMTSIKEEQLEDSIFAIPADYQEMKLPSLPAGLGGDKK